MVRRRWLIAHVALLGALIALALPSSSSALDAAFVYLTPTGPSPVTLTMQAGMYPVWMNEDTVAHTVAFASGCSIDVAPGAIGQCPADFSLSIGANAYTVDGTTQASVIVNPDWRSVTLTAKRHGFRRGSKVRLHGTVAVESLSPRGGIGPRMPVTVFERPRGHRHWYRLAVVTAKPLKKWHYPTHSVWQLWVRPHGPTTYMVKSNSQPKGGQFWLNAVSKPFGFFVRRR